LVPTCNAPPEAIEWYSKITGYYSRVKRWNDGKKAEWEDRLRRDVNSGLVIPEGSNVEVFAKPQEELRNTHKMSLNINNF
jgi:hypothetical protein